MSTSVQQKVTSASVTSFASKQIEIDGVNVRYREAGPSDAPALLLLLQGIPTSSLIVRNLMQDLTGRYRVILPDSLRFGITGGVGAREYLFDALAEAVGTFVDALKLEHYSLYVFDIGVPVGLRLASAHPERVTALIFAETQCL